MPVTHSEAEPASAADAPESGHDGYDERVVIVDPGLWPKLRRRLWMPLVLLIALGAIGFFLGHRKAPNYTATVKLTVGSVSSQTTSLPSFSIAAQTLAQSYALTARSPSVLIPLARSEHASEARMAKAIRATAVPNTTVFSISATQPTKARAIALVNAASAQTQKAIAALNTSTEQENAALRTYRRYALEATNARLALVALRKSAAHGTTVNSAKIAAAEVAVTEAFAKAKAYSARYQALVNSTSQSGLDRVVVIQAANGATSDHRTNIERYVALGLAGGLVVGVLLALVIPARRRSVTGDAPE